MFAVSGLAITLFLGGWLAPVSFLQWIPSYVWFFTKLLALIALAIWVRGTLPRLRMDQLMAFAWKFMLPMALIDIVAAGIWNFTPPGLTRWIVCLALVAGPYVLLARGLVEHSRVGKRTYRYAE
jgi:NADH-quinone oxidoreductase subunit H